MIKASKYFFNLLSSISIRFSYSNSYEIIIETNKSGVNNLRIIIVDIKLILLNKGNYSRGSFYKAS